MLGSLAAMKEKGTRDLRLRTLTEAILKHQQMGEPAHRWPVAEMNETDDWSRSYQTVGQFMSTDLFTVQPDDLIDLVASVMDWRHIRHVPVEDGQGRLVGLLSHRSLLRLLVRGRKENQGEAIAVSSIMTSDPVTVKPTTPTMEAVDLMRRHKVGCLPVVNDGLLVGIITAHDFLEISARLFEERLRSKKDQSGTAAEAV